MTTKTEPKIYEDFFQNFRKAAEANLKMQQDVLNQWTNLWPGLPSPQSAWVDKMKAFQKQWTDTVAELARKHRDTLDRQYQIAMESFEEAMRIGESSNPEEFRQRTEHLYRKTLDCLREVSETQMKEFQEAMNKWSELITKKDA